MKKSIKTVLLSTLLLGSLAHAGNGDIGSVGIKRFKTHTPIAYMNTFEGATAERLFKALKNAGAKVSSYADSNSVSVTSLKLRRYSGAFSEETDVCYKKPSYTITFVDQNDSNKKIELEGDCNDNVTLALGEALEQAGGDDVYDCAMGGKCGFKASDVFISSNNSGYSGQAVVGK